VSQLGGDAGLPRVRTRGMVRGRERNVGSEQRFDGHRSDHACCRREALCVEHQQCPDGTHLLRAVEQRKALLGLQAERLEPCTR